MFTVISKPEQRSFTHYCATLSRMSRPGLRGIMGSGANLAVGENRICYNPPPPPPPPMILPIIYGCDAD